MEPDDEKDIKTEKNKKFEKVLICIITKNR